MDQDSCDHLLHTRGHLPGPDPVPHCFLPVPHDTPPRAADPAGTLAAGLHIRPVPPGAGAAASHHVALLHIQLLVQGGPRSEQDQEEEVKHQHC